MPEEWALDTGASEPAMDIPKTPVTLASPTPAAAESAPVTVDSPIHTENTATPDSPLESQEMDISEVSSTTSAAMDRSGQELRQRSNTTSSTTSESQYGKIQVTLRYSQQRQKLVLVIHKCLNLIPCDDDQLADPYVRVHVLPEHSSSNKRKTEVCKNNLNPIFDETVEWSMTLAEASSKTLELTVKNEVGLFSKNRKLMGVVVISLSECDLTKATTQWYDLSAAEE